MVVARCRKGLPEIVEREWGTSSSLFFVERERRERKEKWRFLKRETICPFFFNLSTQTPLTTSSTNSIKLLECVRTGAWLIRSVYIFTIKQHAKRQQNKNYKHILGDKSRQIRRNTTLIAPNANRKSILVAFGNLISWCAISSKREGRSLSKETNIANNEQSPMVYFLPQQFTNNWGAVTFNTCDTSF